MTASPAQLLIMLYDAAIRNAKLAVEDIKKQDYLAANEHLLKVQDIVNEFIVTLDRSAPISGDLLRLYEYFQHRLIEGNMKKSIEPIEEVIGYLQDFKQTWTQAALLIKQDQSKANQKALSGTTHG
jgi:flagellar protein FliS